MASDMVIYPARLRPDGKREWRNPADVILTFVAILALVGAAYSLNVAASAWKSRDAEALYAILPYWVLGPPVWFWCDYFLVYRHFGDKNAFESFKHAQHVSLAIWAGVAFFLGGVAASDHMKPAKEVSSASCPEPSPRAPGR